MAVDYEKLGLFYLGKQYDLAAGNGATISCCTTRRIS
jgi:hypothetical protein